MDNSRFKFRAWHHGAGVMLQENDGRGTTNPLDCCKYALEGQDVTLIQWTGLQDKNGVDIYEGDVCKVFDEDRFINYSTVKYGEFSSYHEAGYSVLNCHVGFFLSNHEGEQTRNCCGENVGWNSVTVCGNIYTNPELIKEK